MEESKNKSTNSNKSFLPEDRKTRCGWMWASTDWLFGLFGKEDPYKRACKLHDDFFGDPQGLSRKQVDHAFYDAMTAIWERYDKPWLMWIQKQVYYGIARGTGWLFW